jgi:SNF2 family DNA or RNA helicase
VEGIGEEAVSGYEYRSAPYDYQRDLFRKTANKRGWCIFWDPGLGKTKVGIDTVSYLYQQGKIDCVVIIAPKGVDRNWITDEIPVHMPEDVLSKVYTFVYRADKVKTKKAQSAMDEVMAHRGLSFVVAAYDSVRTAPFKSFMKRLFKHRKVFMGLDESQRIKSSTSQVKTTTVAMAKHAAYVRCFSGTPVEVPTDIYPQVKAVDPEFWVRKGLPTYAEFKNMFCVYAARQYGARKFEQIVGYKNIEILREWVAEISTRLTKEDAGLQLPPKVYTKRYHEMSAEQSRVYTELRLNTQTLLESGDLLEVESPMVRLLRLQQIVCGYVATGEGEPLQRIGKENPRLDLCLEICEDLPHQAVIFSRFTNDISQLCAALGKKAVRYDGTVDDDTRAHVKKRFQSGDVQFFVASDAAAEGLTLIGGKTMIFYANDFKLIKRLQKEDRIHRVGQTVSVNYIDLVCAGTVDEDIVRALCNKFDIANQLTGDKLRDWIR